MKEEVFNILNKDEYNAAAPTDIIALLPAPGMNQLFIQKYVLEFLCFGIVKKEFIHLSGPTGGGKSSLILTLASTDEPRNFELICGYLSLPYKPIYLYEIEMALFDTPAEIYQRRALKDGVTYDEESIIVKAFKDAPSKSNEHYPLAFLKEMGRVHTASVQGGLLNLLTKGEITLPDQTKIPGGHVAVIADSNYQAMEDANHTLVTLDEALKRRFTINIIIDYLSSAEEMNILEHLVKRNGENKPDIDLIKKIVRIGTMVRKYRTEGSLLSVIPPNIYGYLAAYRLADEIKSADVELVLMNTMLGNATKDDRKVIDTLIQNVLLDERYFNRKMTFTEDVF